MIIPRTSDTAAKQILGVDFHGILTWCERHVRDDFRRCLDRQVSIINVQGFKGTLTYTVCIDAWHDIHGDSCCVAGLIVRNIASRVSGISPNQPFPAPPC